MSFDLNKSHQSGAWLHYQRLLLGIASMVYLLWWFAVDRLLAGSFNPLSSRLAICSSFLIVLGLSFRLPFMRRNLDVFYALCVYALTLHYFYLFNNNPSDINWVVGSYITVVAVGMTLERLSIFIGFTALVLVSTWYVVSKDPSSAVAIPGMITILILLQIVVFLRSKTEAERQRRVKAEAERASFEAISRAKSLFLANMSHELRTPLTSILGFSDLLADAEELSTDSKDCLERIRVNSLVLMETVDQILNLTEDDFTQLQINIAALSIRELVAKQLTEIKANIQKNISFSQTVREPFSDLIMGDATSIGRILRNVLNNAIKFTDKGEIAIAMSTRASSRQGFVTLMITVRDTGIGIEAADHDRVFDSFLQVQNDYNRPFGGVGLGLTIARKIARLMGGDVTIAESIPGIGTTVRIMLEAQTLPDLREA